MLFAADHSFSGSARRSAVASIHAMSPWWPALRYAPRFSAAARGAFATVNPTASKPSARARARIRSRKSSVTAGPLEVELRIMRHRRLTRHAVAEQGAEGGTRFDPDVPVGELREFRPGDLAVIIECREMRGKREIG